MSVLIKGMNTPKRCFDCMFCRSTLSGSFCIALHGLSVTSMGIRTDCPLVELPEKHGDLIDRDEFLKHMNTAIAMMSDMMKAMGAEGDKGMQMELKAYRDIGNGVKDMTTVIEAEGEP